MRTANPSGFALLQKKAPLVGAFFMGVIWHFPVHAHCPVPVRPQQVAVRHVVDGDTLRLVDGRSVRMIGINTPEIGRRGRASEPGAEAARLRLQQLVRASDGRVGLVPGKEARDHHGRMLAHVYGRDGSNFEARLLAEGLGYQIAIAPNVRLVQCQQQAEATARRARLGLWARSPILRAANIRQSGFAVVAGRVTRVERNRGGVWLVLDDRIRIQIPKRLQTRFPARFLDGLAGRTVEARGWLRDRNIKGKAGTGRQRWFLPITDPSMLKRLDM